MSLRVDASQTTACPGGPVVGKVCVGVGQKLDVIVVAADIPANGYIFAQAWIDYDNQGLANKDNTQALWPDIEPNTFLTIDAPASHHRVDELRLDGPVILISPLVSGQGALWVAVKAGFGVARWSSH